jgi:hypothetical protein
MAATKDELARLAVRPRRLGLGVVWSLPIRLTKIVPNQAFNWKQAADPVLDSAQGYERKKSSEPRYAAGS